ncbi:ATPase [Kineobactrum sediminis]|uniref:ATPase n=1 Tax=Kineobactrum sediminis TaxID=1905677 RepID=A0A2N5XYF4_9GAMM|nr:HAD-IC family P-type ATPase [Kineobactrum sediminis]PLW81175.1 ATPase [Kineobactrum sediminis]
MSQPAEKFYSLDPEEVLDHFTANQDSGLSGDEVDQRLEQYGANVLRESQPVSTPRIFFRQFKSVVILLLGAAGALALLTGRWHEGIAIIAVMLINTLIGFFSEWKALRSMEALRDLGKQQAQVRRDGGEHTIDEQNLVPGDIVLLSPETLVPADLRLLPRKGEKTEESREVQVNEAALTGESVPVMKTPEAVAADTVLADRTCMLYKGTSVTDGDGEGVVVATGMDTELGHISQLAQSAEGKTTPLQKKLDELGGQLAWVTIGITIIVAITGLVAGRDTMVMIETAIALGIAAIPEGLPIVATVALARGMYLMSTRNAVVNHLAAVETLGATRIIFTDKTGTLTANKMVLKKIVTPEGVHELDDSQQNKPDLANEPLLRRALEVGVLCNNARLEDQQQKRSGDPTELALLEAGALLDKDRAELLEEFPEEREEPFDSDTMKMATFHRIEGGFRVAVKGAPEVMLDACTAMATNEGETALSEDERDSWKQRADELAGEGLRLLAVAEKTTQAVDDDPYAQLCFLGLVGMADPPRADIREAVEECQQAGIRAVMVTGDRPDTGQAIAEQVGLASSGAAIHGRDLGNIEALSTEERNRILKADVFARVTPEHKLQLVKIFQDSGEVVAMTGDGVNDAPALKQADIGIAMGERGSDAAKQVADMVLRDDNFSTIVTAVRQGRVIFANIRKSVIFMLCTNLAEILVVSLASLTQAPLPLHPLQILFLNILTDVFPALALGVGVGSSGVMQSPPRPSGEAVITRHHWHAIGGWSLVVGACVLAAFTLALLWLQVGETEAITISFLTLGFSKLWFVLNLRDRGSRPWNNDVVRNLWIWAALVFCSCLLLLAVYWPPLAGVLQTAIPGSDGWMLILGMSLVPAALGLFAPGIRFHTVSNSSRG